MCGPAYVTTMVQLFSHREEPLEVLLVGALANSGRLDTHPPAALRVAVALRLLVRLGFARDAAALRARWDEQNPVGESEGALLVPVHQRFFAVPAAPYVDLAWQMAERLYAGPLEALGGGGLRDVSGLDLGPHEWEEATRSKAAFLSGQTPRTWDPRAVIAGAVLAAQEKPDREAQVLALARKAIVAHGSFEQRPAQTAVEVVAADEDPVRLVAESIVLGALLNPRGRLRRPSAR
jgi:hypothetical protein